MSKFPIANMICDDAPVDAFLRIATEILEDHRKLKDKIKSSVFFDSNIASKLYWLGRQEYYDLRHDFGPIMPPYDDLWMEWSVPSRIQIEGQWHERPDATSSPLATPNDFAAHVCTLDVDLTKTDEHDVRRMLNMFRERGQVKVEPTAKDYQHLAKLYRRVKVSTHREIKVQMYTKSLGKVLVYPVQKIIRVDKKTGRFDGVPLDLVPKSFLEEYGSSPNATKDLVELADYNTVWLALQLVNCRNVTTKSIGSVFARSGAQKRRGEPVVKYQTIVLPGSQTGHHSMGRRLKQDVLALHKVRGHFKTFTVERPLLGQHVGTYWWGWQVRGNPDNGVVISDYQLRSGISSNA